MTDATEPTAMLSGPDGARYEIPADVLEAARIPDEDVAELRGQVGGEAPDGDVAAYALDWAALSTYRVPDDGATAGTSEAADTSGFQWRGGYFLLHRDRPGTGGDGIGTPGQGWILIAPWRTHVGDGIPMKVERSVPPGVRDNLYG